VLLWGAGQLGMYGCLAEKDVSDKYIVKRCGDSRPSNLRFLQLDVIHGLLRVEDKHSGERNAQTC